MDKHGTIVGVTRRMYYVELRGGKRIRIMQYNVASYVPSTSIWIQQLIDVLKQINKQIDQNFKTILKKISFLYLFCFFYKYNAYFKR
jgi:hypothetical protein